MKEKVNMNNDRNYNNELFALNELSLLKNGITGFNYGIMLN